MRLSELQHKDIINLDGKKIGNIIDIKITDDGSIVALVIETNKTFFRFNRDNYETEITWDKIERIGEDVILVKYL